MGTFPRRFAAMSLACILTTLGFTSVAGATSGPSIQWTSSSNRTVQGPTSLSATASASASNAWVDKWCITVNGSPITSTYTMNWTGPDQYANDIQFDSFSGCYSLNSNYDNYGDAVTDGDAMNGASIAFDTTSWADGTYAFVVTVTDSNGATATSSTLSITTSNGSAVPSFSWQSSNNQTVRGPASISGRARAATSGTAWVDKWCITVNGSPITSTYTMNWTGPDQYANDIQFDSFSGCYSLNSNYDNYGDAVTDGDAMNGASIAFDTTSWADGTYAFVVTVTDSNGRSTSSTPLNVSTGNSSAVPSFAWQTTNNLSVMGKDSIGALAHAATSGTAWVDKWCITVNGSPITSTYTMNWTGPDQYANDIQFDSFSGCYSLNSNYDNYGDAVTDGDAMNGASIAFDTTSWADGTYAFVVTVTDSNGRSTSSTPLDIRTTNGSAVPSFQWETENNQTFSGDATISAITQAATSGTAWVDKWCITVNGNPITSAFTANWTGVDAYAENTDFNQVTGCYSLNSNYDNYADAVTYGDALNGASIVFDTTAWANGTNTAVITVTDSSGRSTSSTPLSFITSNGGPTVSLTTDGSSPAMGDVTLSASASPDSSGSALISSVCLSVNGSPVNGDPTQGQWGTFEKSTGCWNFDTNVDGYSDNNPGESTQLPLDTSTMINGKQKFVLTTTDTSGRTASASLSLLTKNPPAKLTSLNGQAIMPAWNNTSTSISVSFTGSGASRAVVRFGTTSSMTKSKTVQLDPNSGDSAVVTLSSLAPKTTIYYQVTVTGLNGSTSSSVRKIRTDAIPPKAAIVSTTCMSNEFIGSSILYGPYYYWYWYDVYHWNNGSTSTSIEYESLGAKNPCG